MEVLWSDSAVIQLIVAFQKALLSAQPRGAHWRCTDFIPDQLRVLEDAHQDQMPGLDYLGVP